MNKVILLGRLVRDPEVKMTPSEKTVCLFTIAVDTGYGENKRTDFIQIVAWNKIAENCGNYLLKGQRVLIDGRLQIRSYDGRDGKKKYVTEVIAQAAHFIENKQKDTPPLPEPPTDWEKLGEEIPF